VSENKRLGKEEALAGLQEETLAGSFGKFVNVSFVTCSMIVMLFDG
jgi:hypothetical protein